MRTCHPVGGPPGAHPDVDLRLLLTDVAGTSPRPPFSSSRVALDVPCRLLEHGRYSGYVGGQRSSCEPRARLLKLPALKRTPGKPDA